MSAIPAETTRLRVVESNKAGYSAVLAAKAKARAAYDYIVSLPKSAWTWARQTFHLEPVERRVVGAWGWAKRMLSTGIRMLGTTGLLGAGMLAVSTPSGRQLLTLAATPFVWVGNLVIRIWSRAEDFLLVEEPSGPLDSARNFVSERMADVREFLFGAGTTENRYGFLGNLAVKGLIKAGPYLALDSKTMLTTRALGALLFGVKLFTLAPMLPVAGWVVFLAQGFIGLSTFVAAGDPILQITERITGYRVNATKREGQAAAKVAATVVDTPAKEKDKDSSEPTNRAARRAQERRPQHAR